MPDMTAATTDDLIEHLSEGQRCRWAAACLAARILGRAPFGKADAIDITSLGDWIIGVEERIEVRALDGSVIKVERIGAPDDTDNS